MQAACHALGIRPVIVETNVYQGDGETQEYLGINALGQIPTLVDHHFVLTESNAIMVYLSETYAECALYGTTPRKRAAINRWLFWESSQWQPHLSHILGSHVGHILLPKIFPVPSATPHWKSEPLIRQVSLLERHLSEREWLVDENITLADFSVAGMTTYFATTHFPFEQYPNITAWYKKMSETDAWSMTEQAIYRSRV